MTLGRDPSLPPGFADAVNRDDPQPALDSIIAWIRDRRAKCPTAPFSRLLADSGLSAQVVLDVACIDLIEQRRNGISVRVEDYARDFPELQAESRLLDLIDAEICIERELGNEPALDQLTSRFPELRQQIGDLLHMKVEGGSAAVLLPTESNDVLGRKSRPEDVGEQASPCLPGMTAWSAGGVSDEQDEEQDFSIQNDLLTQVGGMCTSAPHPVKVPDWFVGEKCVASGMGRWLVRGRDATRGHTLAMKIIRLPVQVGRQQIEQLMDACERSAKVQNPGWTVPAVAAVQDRHFAVIRPWLFANPWQSSASTTSAEVRLRQLASVAYTLQSAHSIDATHGGIHASNVLIDHQGNVHLVDGVSSMSIVARWFEADLAFASLQQRKRWDVQDMIKLVAADSIESSAAWADDLVASLRSIVDRQSEQPAAAIGDTLMGWADTQKGQPYAAGPSKRSLGNWLSNWRSRSS